MADKVLKKMSRTELIEIIYALKQNEDTLEREKRDLQRQLDDRNIRISTAGSIAEASMGLSHIFEAAQAAADNYLNSVRSAGPVPGAGNGAEADEEADEYAIMTRAEAEGYAAAVRAMAEDEAEQIIEEARIQAETMTSDSERAAALRIEEAEAQRDEILAEAEQQKAEIIASAQAQRNTTEESKTQADVTAASGNDEDSRAQLEQVERECEERKAAADREIQSKWDEFNQRADNIMGQYKELAQLLSATI